MKIYVLALLVIAAVVVARLPHSEEEEYYVYDAKEDDENDMMDDRKNLEKSSEPKNSSEYLERIACRFSNANRLCSMVCSQKQQQLGRCNGRVCVCY